MILKEHIVNFLSEQAKLKTSYVTKPIINAIKNRNPITFYYSGPYKPRKISVKRGNRYDVEVVAIGLTKKGKLAIRGWVQPPSTSKKGFAEHGWRTFLVSRMSNMTVNESEVWNERRPNYKEGDDRSFSITYASVDWNKIPKPKVVKTTQPTQQTPAIKTATKQTEPKDKLPQPKPETKPNKAPETKPELNPQVNNEPINAELPQPKPEEKPPLNPEDEETEKLNENIKRIKDLILLLN